MTYFWSCFRSFLGLKYVYFKLKIGSKTRHFWVVFWSILGHFWWFLGGFIHYIYWFKGISLYSLIRPWYLIWPILGGFSTYFGWFFDLFWVVFRPILGVYAIIYIDLKAFRYIAWSDHDIKYDPFWVVFDHILGHLGGF